MEDRTTVYVDDGRGHEPDKGCEWPWSPCWCALRRAEERGEVATTVITT